MSLKSSRYLGVEFSRLWLKRISRLSELKIYRLQFQKGPITRKIIYFGLIRGDEYIPLPDISYSFRINYLSWILSRARYNMFIYIKQRTASFIYPYNIRIWLLEQNLTYLKISFIIISKGILSTDFWYPSPPVGRG